MANIRRRTGGGGGGSGSGVTKSASATVAVRKMFAKLRDVKPLELANSLLFDVNYSFIVMCLLVPVELVLNMIIVLKIPYTEIDWIAYMQEVEGFVNGTLNYYELKGDTGPLVYPAGFVYIYTALYWLTSRGANIKLAQFMFVAIYLLFLSVVFVVYNQTKRVQPIALIFMCLTSHRIHSIFLLRLFNDPIAMLFFYASLSFLLLKRWHVACVLFSLAVSIKMNVLLFAPGLFVVLVLATGLFNTFKYIFVCAIVQLILGMPFLLHHPIAYIHRSFDLGRQFFYIWTVNWKFLDETTFTSRYFHLTLLIFHLGLLLLFINKYLRKIGGIVGLLTLKKPIKLSHDAIIFIMFISNFVGICFSRSLHYQFYVWYYHTIPYLLWSVNFPIQLKFLIFGVIELCWNIFPASAYSSFALNACHYLMLVGVWRSLDSHPLL